MYPNKTEHFCILDQGVSHRSRREEKVYLYVTRYVDLQMATMTTATMTVEIDANGLRVRDEFRIMFPVYDLAARHAS